MKNCENCQWEKLNPQGQKMVRIGEIRIFQGKHSCGQGHVITFEKIEDCHAWERKKLCWCQMVGERRVQLHDFDFGVYSMRSPEIPNFCPICGKKIEGLEKVKNA